MEKKVKVRDYNGLSTVGTQTNDCLKCRDSQLLKTEAFIDFKIYIIKCFQKFQNIFKKNENQRRCQSFKTD